jgi:isoleucyl-tRNA synthetase
MNLGILKKAKSLSIGVKIANPLLAEAEVEYLDKTSKSIDVSFEVSNDSLEKVKTIFNQSKPESISFVIWTTTPWTIPSNVAVCINPDIRLLSNCC